MAPAENSVQPDGEWQPGVVVSDRYRLVHEVQRSSTSRLYKVVDVFRDQPNLLFRPSERIMEARERLEWFVTFCRTALSVPDHPNLATCHRLDYEGRVPYLIMDFVDGPMWSRAIEEGELSDLTTMLDIAIQVARGLEWLHENGQIHGNIKPANVMLEEGGRLAKVLKYGETHVMTRAYAAPEQLTDGAPLSNATDVWCWAASVLHMFSGIVNWSDGARAPAALERYLRIGPAIPGLALMPVPVVELLRQCFQVNPKDRPGSTAEVVEQMETHYYNATNTAYEKPVESGRYESEDLVDEDVANRKRQMNQAAEQSAPPPHRFSARDRKSSEKRPSRRNDRS